MFIQYYDIIKPIYLTAINKILLDHSLDGILPIELISKYQQPSLAEWYINRTNINPLIDLDINSHYDHTKLDELLESIIMSDESIYEYSPIMKIHKMLLAFDELRMKCPIFVYSEKYNPHIEKDIETCFKGVVPTYLHGDLKTALSKCDMNYTYIFSDIDLAEQAAILLKGATSHILVSCDYRYNYTDYFRTLKKNLQEIMRKYPICRMERFLGIDRHAISMPLTSLRANE